MGFSIEIGGAHTHYNTQSRSAIVIMMLYCLEDYLQLYLELFLLLTENTLTYICSIAIFIKPDITMLLS
jgi:hypothetical protein